MAIAASRRWALVVAAIVGLAASAGCSGSEERSEPEPTDATGTTTAPPPQAEGRLSARPGPGGGRCEPGEHVLALGGGRMAIMRVTAGGRGARKALLLTLHGAGGGSRDGLYAFRGGWDEPGLVMVSPAAQGSTWSFLRGNDDDHELVDRALARVFARCRVDRRRIGVGGFSDGATYALTLGLVNGDLFSAVVALSPGSALAEALVGKPRVFVAHGTLDDVLPISRTSEVIVRELQSAGYRVTYRKFRGGHKVLPRISRESVRWFLGR